MRNRTFPSFSRSADDIREAMAENRRDDRPWCDARSFKPAYYAGDDIVSITEEAFRLHLKENALFGASAYPSLAKYDKELVAMLLDLLGAPEGAGGSTSVGGTESIVMCMKAARNWAREHRPGARAPEIVVPRTAHPAFAKGADMLGLKVVRMAGSVDWCADVAGMAQAINDDTIMLVGSAPPYPYGQTDPIAEIAALAQSHGLWMHVDGCIGGLILPFLKRLGAPIPDFDFSVAGVMSMSVDVHKFGYAHKGLSAVLLREAGLERYQRTDFDAWPAGAYSTANIIGSRSGGPLASGWAVMNYLGDEGYQRIFAAQLEIKQRLMDGIRAIDGLEICVRPDALHIVLGATELVIFAVLAVMAARVWSATRMREPDAMLLWINLSHGPIVEAYLDDLAAVVRGVQAGTIVADSREAVYSTYG